MIQQSITLEDSLLADNLRQPLVLQPREKLCACGAQSLSDGELMSVLLGSGTAKIGVVKLAQSVVAVLDRKGEHTTIVDLLAIPGIGSAKATLILSSLEFARRRLHSNGSKIRSAADAYKSLQHLSDRHQEHFVCISLNGAHEVIASRIITIGLVNSAQVHPREVFSDPLKDRATAVIVAHNHPSGDLTPSSEDMRVTQNLKAAGTILGITVLDHVIFSRRGFYSFAESSQLLR